jgi:hypothetical protein
VIFAEDGLARMAFFPPRKAAREPQSSEGNRTFRLHAYSKRELKQADPSTVWSLRPLMSGGSFAGDTDQASTFGGVDLTP